MDGDDAAEFPDITDLARACDGMRIDEMAHIVRSHVDATTVDVLLHARTWWSENTTLPTALGDFGAPPREVYRAPRPA